MPSLLSEFLEELRGEGSGFEAGDGQYLAALTLLETMASRGEVPASPEGWGTLLGPVLCSSPAQQMQFQELYKEWLARLLKPVTTQPLAPPGRKTAQQKARYKSAQLVVLLRRFSHGLWVLAIGCVCALAFLVYRHLHPPPQLQQTIINSVLTPDPHNGETACTTPTCTLPAQTSLRVRSPSGAGVEGATVYYAGLTGYTDLPGDFALDRSRTPDARYALVIGSGYLPSIVQLKDADQEVRLAPLPAVADTGWRSFPSKHIWAISLLSSLCLALGGLWLLRVWRSRLELKKWAAPASEERRSLGFALGGRGVYRPAGIRALATALRRRRPEESADLDAAATVESTARNAGYFTPVYTRRTSEPDYLFVGERKNLRDHQARLHDELVTRLRDHDVQLQRYYFQSDPRICVDSKGVCCALPELASVFRDHEVWLSMDAELCLDARTHRPHKWWSVFERWHDRLLLTPTPPDFNLETLAARPTRAGLTAFLDSSSEARGANVPFPSVLRGAAGEWLDRSEPPPALLARLIAQLQMYLGPAGYLLLQACAVYPELAWNITVTLAREVLAEADVEPALERLVELPWFRHGIMPDWLRVRLVSRLGTREAGVRIALLHYLESANSTAQQMAEVLNILPGAPKLKPRPGPLEDHVYLSFVRGQLGELSVEAPSRWKRLLLHPQLPGPWAIACGICALSFVAGSVTADATDKHPLTLKVGSYGYLLYQVATAQEGSQAPIDAAAAIQADSAVVADLMNVADPVHRDGDRLEIAGALSFKAGAGTPAPGMLAEMAGAGVPAPGMLTENEMLGGGTNPLIKRLELIKNVDGDQVTFFRLRQPVSLARVAESLDLSNVTPSPASVRPVSTPEPPKTTARPSILPVVSQPAPSLAMRNAGTRTPPVNTGGAAPMVVDVPAMETTADGTPRPTSVPLPSLNSANRDPLAVERAAAAATVSQISPDSAANEAFARALVESRKVLSSDGKLIAKRESTLITISTSAGRAVREIEAPQPVGAVAWSPDSRLLAAADVYGTVSLWEVATGELHSKFAGTSLISSLAWSPNGSVLAVGDALEGILLYDPLSGKHARILKTTGQRQPIVQSMEWDTRGVLLTCTYPDGIRVWNVLSGELVSQKPVITSR